MNSILKLLNQIKVQYQKINVMIQKLNICILFSLVVFLSTACSQNSFDKKDWATLQGVWIEYRDKDIADFEIKEKFGYTVLIAKSNGSDHPKCYAFLLLNPKGNEAYKLMPKNSVMILSEQNLLSIISEAKIPEAESLLIKASSRK